MKPLWVLAATIALIVGSLLGSLFASLLKQELWAWCPVLAKALVRSAVRFVPVKDQDRYEQEWLAELDMLDDGRNLSQVVVAARIRLTARSTSRELREDTGEPVVRIRITNPTARRSLPPVVVLLAVGALWYSLSYLVLDSQRRFLVPPPHEVIQVSLLDPLNRQELLGALWLSTRVASTGLAIATVVGLLLAVAMSRARWIERSLYPYAVLTQTIPILACVPALGFWFGYGSLSRVLVVVLFAVFPVIANTLFGLQSVQQAHHDLFALQGAGWLTRLWKLQFPAALPSIFTGLRIAASLAVIGAIVADTFFKQGEPGIGGLIGRYPSRLQSEQMVAAIALSALLGIVVFWFFGFLARRVVGGWHESAGGLDG
jgi:NitT/TauT family transport system permease protein